MGRVGAAPEAAAELARAIAAVPELRLEGVFTHLAVADEPADEYTAGQLARFDAALAELDAAGLRPPLVHAANSAGGLAHGAARHDLVRVGIAAYGIEPGPGVAEWTSELRPALRLMARVSHVKQMPAGARISYGLRHTFTRATTVATVPIGYADGVPRRLSATGGEVLIAGRRCPIVGVVTMDQLMVDCGDLDVAVGDEVVLLGAQGTERIRPEEWATRLGTIAYEIVCGLSRRIERRPAPR
jgi:alanine racemase